MSPPNCSRFLEDLAAYLPPSRSRATIPSPHQMLFRSTTQRQSLSGQVTLRFHWRHGLRTQEALRRDRRQPRRGIASGISKKVHYLVVGEIGNEQWLHSTYGTKIKRAVELREEGHPIAIISEKHWQASMFNLI